eukprot:GGOE01044732.1.p1 GENE.GGOE01044732.1~~GGOE01044732.1.p1  ORF type:complete len:632 (-),score=197.65 GGOE01044732.1:289-2004(-)
MAAGDIVMPNRGQYTFRINTDAGYLPPFANAADQDEDGMRHHVRVAVLGCQSLLAQSGGPMGLSVLVGENDDHLIPIGGSWNRELDGPDPDDEATLQATARRVALAFCKLDLSSVPLVKLTELRFSPATLRGEAVEGEGNLSAPERTVFYLAAPWSAGCTVPRVDVRSQAILPPKDFKDVAATPEDKKVEESGQKVEEDVPADADMEYDHEEGGSRLEPPSTGDDAQDDQPGERSEDGVPKEPTDTEGPQEWRIPPDAMVVDAEAEEAGEGLEDPPPTESAAKGEDPEEAPEKAAAEGDSVEPGDADAEGKGPQEEKTSATTGVGAGAEEQKRAMEDDMDEVRKALMAQLFRAAVTVASPTCAKSEQEPEPEPEQVVVHMVTRPLLSLVDPPLASKPATFELCVLAETLWEMWQCTYGLVVYDALKAFASKREDWAERQKRKRSREPETEGEAVAKKPKGEGEDPEEMTAAAEAPVAADPPAEVPTSSTSEPAYDCRTLEAFRFFDLRAADAIRCSDLDALLQSLRLGLTADAIARLVRPHTPKGRRLQVLEYLDVCNTLYVPTEVPEDAE